jgi:L-fuculose-phosphate aldolase
MYEKERKQMLEICREMLEKDLVIGSAGNVSMRVEDHIIITPSSVRYTEMEPADFMVMDMNADVVEGDRNPSVELPMHLAVYKNREDALAIVHSHSVYASAMALLNKSLPPILDELVPKLGGEIRVTPYEMPGSSELGEQVVKAMELRSATIIANHGALCCGGSLREALDVALLLERACRIYLIALQFGKPTQLPEEVVEMESDLWQMLKGY